MKKKSMFTFFLMFFLMVIIVEKDTIHAEQDIQIAEQGLQLIYGNPDISDDEAFVMFVLGDGFTVEEQEKFYHSSKVLMTYVLSISPFDEFADVTKVYALGVISKDSGAIGENAQTQEEALQDTRQNVFGSSFWNGGIQRLLYVSSEGLDKVEALKNEYVPRSDTEFVIVNSQTYGGGGGKIGVASLESSSREILLHELGHSLGNLADEYYAGSQYNSEKANMTAESDPEKVRWKKFIGKNGIGVYEYENENGGTGWYHPHERCKMKSLGYSYHFCEVCKEQLRIVICQKIDMSKLFFQPYATQFYESEEGYDMSKHFILRSGYLTKTGDTLDDYLTLVYKDSDGNIVDGIPNKAGTYTIEASVTEGILWNACNVTATYTIQPASENPNLESETSTEQDSEEISSTISSIESESQSQTEPESQTSDDSLQNTTTTKTYIIIVALLCIGIVLIIVAPKKNNKQ